MSHSACHALHVTLCMSHSACHTLHVTLCLSHSACHTLLVTLCMSHSACHTLLVTLCLSHSACHTLLGRQVIEFVRCAADSFPILNGVDIHCKESQQLLFVNHCPQVAITIHGGATPDQLSTSVLDALCVRLRARYWLNMYAVFVCSMQFLFAVFACSTLPNCVCTYSKGGEIPVSRPCVINFVSQSLRE